MWCLFCYFVQKEVCETISIQSSRFCFLKMFSTVCYTGKLGVISDNDGSRIKTTGTVSMDTC